jgi:DNA-directed RNA polymerase specialized sigma24 family protein
MRPVADHTDVDYSDQELIERLKEESLNEGALSLLYKRHKNYCINFMKSMYNDHDTLNDIYHDAVMTFYEKINTQGFVLTCRVQTYLNSVCRNQILKRYHHSKKFDAGSNDGNQDFLDTVQDTLEEYDDVNSLRIRTMETVLKEWKQTSQKCHEILIRFWYQNQTMDTIADRMKFAHADSAKSQKAKCQKEFKSAVYKRLNSVEP